ncbi:unnamed protein product [Alopecurus aequalis]
MDPYKQLFYQSAKAATEAADEATMKGSLPARQTLQLPRPSMNFTASDCGGSLDMFALFSPRGTSEGRILYSNTNGEAGLYDADRHVHNTLGLLKEPKGLSPICLSIAHPGSNEDSILALKTWRWRLLPPPPFVRQPGYNPSDITAYTTLVDGSGCSTIYVSCSDGIGTYRFETARHDPSCRKGWRPSEEWSYVGAWGLPFDGGAQYVPEFNLWFGFSDVFPNHLCAADLSAMDRERRPPTVLQDWQDVNLPDGQVWLPVYCNLVNLGNGKFVIAKTLESEETGERFAALTGVEMMAGVGDDQSLTMVKHKCAHFVFGEDTIERVL